VNTSAQLVLDRVGKSFGSVTALDDVSLEVQRGEVVAIIGPSGAGKSTLIRCVHMLESYDSGAIYLAGEQLGYGRDRRGDLRPLPAATVARQRARMGMVFQHFNLFPNRTVLQNVVEGPTQVKRERAAEANVRAQRLLSLVGLDEMSARYPRQLSGGQQQRVAIARALAMEPELLLFDEPTSALDPETVGEVLATMKQVTELGTTTVVVTHEIKFARDVADRIVFMEKGRIVEQGPPSEILGTPTPRMQAFLKATVAE